MTAFATAFDRWSAAPNPPPFPDLMQDSLDRLREALHAVHPTTLP